MFDEIIDRCCCECGEYFDGTDEDDYCSDCWTDLNGEEQNDRRD